MDYEKMWNKLKETLEGYSGYMDGDDVILMMNDIEEEAYNE